MKKFFCSECNEEKTYAIKQNVITEYKGYKLKVIENIAVCDICSNEIFIPELENENLNRLYDEYRKVASIVSPKEIIEFRQKYNLSQRELVAILNWGKMTINRYENGALPDESHNLVLKSIINDEKLFLEKVNFSYKNEKIKESTFNKVNNNTTKRNPGYEIIERLDQKENIYNGFRRFDLTRMENVIGYIASKVDNLYLTSLNKYLWFIDFAAFKSNTRSILGIPYVKHQYGPVIAEDCYYKIVCLPNEKYGKEEEENFNSTGIITKICSKNNYDLSLFKASEFKLIELVISKLKNLSCKEISDLSHDEDGWKETPFGNSISYEYASKLKNF